MDQASPPLPGRDCRVSSLTLKVHQGDHNATYFPVESEKVRARHRETLCEEHLNPTCQRYAEALVCNREVLCEAYECKEALSKVSEGQEDRLDIDVPLETWAEVRAFVKDDEDECPKCGEYFE